jgi:hypothetical protein
MDFIRDQAEQTEYLDTSVVTNIHRGCSSNSSEAGAHASSLTINQWTRDQRNTSTRYPISFKGSTEGVVRTVTRMTLSS